MQALVRYQQTTRPDTALLLSQYRVTDIVRHSVGIGSFGTTCYLVLLTGLGDSTWCYRSRRPYRGGGSWDRTG